jgi:hypothetical protein
MARHSAINAVADAVVAALNVPAFRALCPGGVYRNLRPNQTPPYCVVGPCSEEPDDMLGYGYGAALSVPVTVVQMDADAVPEARAVTIIDQAMTLLDEPASWTITGWLARGVEWQGTAPTRLEFQDGSGGDALRATFVIRVRTT